MSDPPGHGLLWMILVLLRWFHHQFIEIPIMWFLDTVIHTSEEIIKSAIRELFIFLTRLINGAAAITVSLFVDRSFWRRRRGERRSRRKPQVWKQLLEDNSGTFNALLEQAELIPAREASPPARIFPRTSFALWTWRCRNRQIDKGTSLPRRGSDLFDRPSGYAISERARPRGLLEIVRIWMELQVESFFSAVRLIAIRILFLRGGNDVDNIAVPSLSPKVDRQSGRGDNAHGWQDITSAVDVDKSTAWTASDVILHAGYPLEEQVVTTSDGYVLTMQRIPRKDSRHVVFFQHGVMDTSLGWVANGIAGSQAFAAFDNGADVWLGSSRSNPPHLHVNKDSSQRGQYWHFSINELGMEDVAAQIDWIHRVKCAELSSGLRGSAISAGVVGGAVDMGRESARETIMNSFSEEVRNPRVLHKRSGSDSALSAAHQTSLAAEAISPSPAPNEGRMREHNLDAGRFPRNKKLKSSTNSISTVRRVLSKLKVRATGSSSKHGNSIVHRSLNGDDDDLRSMQHDRSNPSSSLRYDDTKKEFSEDEMKEKALYGEANVPLRIRRSQTLVASHPLVSDPRSNMTVLNGGIGCMTYGTRTHRPRQGNDSADGLSDNADDNNYKGLPLDRASHSLEVEDGRRYQRLRHRLPVLWASGPSSSIDGSEGKSSSLEMSSPPPDPRVSSSMEMEALMAPDRMSLGGLERRRTLVEPVSGDLSIGSNGAWHVRGTRDGRGLDLETSSSSDIEGLLDASRPHAQPEELQKSETTAALSYHLSQSGNRDSEPYRLQAVGHSLGAASLLVYAVMCGLLGRSHRLSRLVLLTPAGFHRTPPKVAWPFLYAVPALVKLLRWIRPGMGTAARIPSPLLRYVMFKLTVDLHQIPALNELSRAALRLLLNGDASEWDRALQMPHYNEASMPAISLHTGDHIMQLIKRHKFLLYDYGSAEANMRQYGQPEPLDVAEHYRVLKGLPVDLVAGRSDGVVAAEDVIMHYEAMQKAGLEVSYKEMDLGHLDLTFAVKNEVQMYLLRRLGLDGNPFSIIR